jgi:hypothetical protein
MDKMLDPETSKHDQALIEQKLFEKQHHIPVISYNNSLEKELLDACAQTKTIGLTHIRLGFERYILICLTTKSAIFVLDTRHKSHVDLIRILLNKENHEGYRFYTTRGHFVVYRLLTEFGIDPDTKLMIDLPAFEVFLSMRNCCLSGSLMGKYTFSRLIEMRDTIKYHDRIDLTRKHLNIALDERDEKKERKETRVIRDYPESEEAKDVIRKRACLVDDLAARMEERFDTMTFQDSNNLYSFAHQVKGDKYIEYENLGDDSYATVIEFLKK